MPYLPRTLDTVISELIPHTAAIAIDGPKGVGKTDTALQRADHAWYLDEPKYQDLARSDFWLSSLSEGTILIDEWQKYPPIWDSVRRQVDQGAPGGRFLLTGSATPVDPSGTHSGAGRIFSLRMRPMALHERGVTEPTVSLQDLLSGGTPEISGRTPFKLMDYAEAIVNSGFPATLTQPPRIRREFLNTYIQCIIDRDMADQGFQVRQPATLRRWLQAYAAASSTITSYAKLRDAATSSDGMQPTKSTTNAYRDHLTQLWLLDPVPGWVPFGSPLKRLQSAPKHQLADPALAASLLGLSASSFVNEEGAHMAGQLFESLATLTVRVAAQPAEATVSHLRMDSGRHEIDLIVQDYANRIVAIEVKLAETPSDRDVQHLKWLREQMPDRVADLVVITTGEYAYRRQDGIAVVPLALLGP